MGSTAPADTLTLARTRANALGAHGAVTPGYDADRSVVLGMLDAALATELVCVLRYRRHAFTVWPLHGMTAIEAPGNNTGRGLRPCS
jgi:bacterioferritin